MKQLIAIMIALLLPLAESASVPALAPAPEGAVDLSAPCAILMDRATGTVLYEKNPDQPREPASVTKIMTLLLVMEALDRGQIGWEDQITASAAAAGKGGSQIFLEEGERLSLEEMLKSVVVSSANDCATALAEHVAGSEEAFAAQMNRRAEELGMEHTHFVNCTGLDDSPEARDHLTTARDVALMSRALLGHDEIRRYTTIWTDTVRNGAFGLSNTNKLIRFYRGATGLKTGYTSTAGHCLSASAERDGLELIAVVLGADSSTHRFEDAKALLNWGFANYALADPTEGLTLAPVPVLLGREETVSVAISAGSEKAPSSGGAGDPALGGGVPEAPEALPQTTPPGPLLLEKGQAAGLSREVELAESVEAPVTAGQAVGTLRVKAADGSLLGEYPIVAAAGVERLSFWDLLARLAGEMVT